MAQKVYVLDYPLFSVIHASPSLPLPWKIESTLYRCQFVCWVCHSSSVFCVFCVDRTLVSGTSIQALGSTRIWNLVLTWTPDLPWLVPMEQEKVHCWSCYVEN